MIIKQIKKVKVTNINKITEVNKQAQYHLKRIHTIHDASIPSTAPLDPTPTGSGNTIQLRKITKFLRKIVS